MNRAMLPLRDRRVALAAIPISVGAVYIYNRTRKNLAMESPSNTFSKTLTFPYTMLFSKTLIVTNVEDINHDTKRITFDLPGGLKEVSGVGLGAAVLTQHTPLGAWLPVLRPYTPISDPLKPGNLQLLVKKYPGGRASTYLHTLVPGSTLTVRGPLPGYNYSPSSQPRHLLFIAGGAGITPIYSLVRGILTDDTDRTRVQLLWGVNGARDLVLKAELDDLQRRYPDKLQVTYAISGEEPNFNSDVDVSWKKGHIDQSLLRETISSCLQDGTELWGDPKGKKVFLCGPPKMEAAIAGSSGVLKQLGIEGKDVHIF